LLVWTSIHTFQQLKIIYFAAYIDNKGFCARDQEGLISSPKMLCKMIPNAAWTVV